MKYFLSILIIGVSGFVGNLFARRYVERDCFYKEMKSMLVYFKSNISFLQMKVAELFDNYMKEKADKNKKKLLRMKDVVLCRDEKRLEYKDFYFLKKEEREEIESFIKGLGLGSIDSELNKIDIFQKLVERKMEEVSDLRKKNEGLTYKLSLSIGVILCILII